VLGEEGEGEEWLKELNKTRGIREEEEERGRGLGRGGSGDG